MQKNGVIPSKANPEKQEEFLNNSLEPLLEEERKGKRRVFFVDAAHFVMGAFLGMLWCFERLFLKSSSGRKRCYPDTPFTLVMDNVRYQRCAKVME